MCAQIVRAECFHVHSLCPCPARGEFGPDDLAGAMQCQHRGALAAGRLSCCCSSCSSSASSPWLFQALWLFSWLLSFYHISSSLCWSLAPRFHSSLQIKSGFLPLPDASGFWFMLSLTFVWSKEIQGHCWNILFISPLKGLCSCLAGFLIFSSLCYLLVLLMLFVWNTLLLLCFFSMTWCLNLFHLIPILG